MFVDNMNLPWRTSSFCTNAACVEVAITAESVFVADSKESRRRILAHTRSEWRDFITGVKSGAFSH
ncbi:DUF397 domain-containing protein [Actinoplanes utahensis]|uniref:DUF397 domain-containing protein n=1 Tax=Actinoplanes utahensis TaxID=1869 RepID=A0A0A6WYI5_ACTUT|nr:DUF397 domain-containing protein [Actinoplanes utahensis]KHD72817.1 hypothetical protein MB27_39380 [Actinoplanes utahensis]